MRRHRKIIYSLVATAAIASSVAVTKLNQISQQSDQISASNAVQVTHQTQTTNSPCLDLWAYVYHPNRLPTKNDCRTVTGTVMWVKHEPDADYHLRIQLSDPNSAPVNAKNIGQFLVAEPICQTEGMPQPTQADAVAGCAQYVKDGMPQFPMPKVGDHITITGFYTLDKQHSWMEIHNAIIR